MTAYLLLYERNWGTFSKYRIRNNSIYVMIKIDTIFTRRRIEEIFVVKEVGGNYNVQLENGRENVP